MKKTIIALALTIMTTSLIADNGHGLWLNPTVKPSKTVIITKAQTSPSLDIAKEEIRNGWNGGKVTLVQTNTENKTDEGFTINIKSGKAKIQSKSAIGLLYGTYHLLRMQNSGMNVKDTALVEDPQFSVRILDHWDNLDETVERGYAGPSIFWTPAPEQPQLIKDYARANASIGINAAVLNNVNASVKTLDEEHLAKVKEFADIMRPYGVKVYLSVNFASPMGLGKLDTADPSDSRVQQWWKDKAEEIYGLIPDFGGFLVKANSEGQPGPNDYGRSHSEGANMLARALKPHNGIIMWRSFVYAPNDPDRAKQAYKEFKPLDGQFDDNVIIQIKNGPVDFQPREPFTPLFGALKNTKEMVEFQVTQEYLGHSNHIVYLAPMWEEFYSYVKPSTLVAASGVSNIGRDINWCGNVMAQSNWYAFGRQSWNPSLSSKEIADEWVKQTLKPQTEKAENTIVDLMLRSREACVDYMMPMGIHHIFAGDCHYGPQPWMWVPGLRADWQPPYYHKADSIGLGFDRTTKGTDAVSQYPSDFANLVNNIETCPERFLLWFHHVAWNYQLPCGETMWNRLCHHYQHGVEEVREMQKEWNSVEGTIDSEIFSAIKTKLNIQMKDAIWWKDGCLEYFGTFSKLPYPKDVEPTQHSLDELKKVHLGLGVYGCPSEELLDSQRK